MTSPIFHDVYTAYRATAQANPASITATAVRCPKCGAGPGWACPGYRGGNEAHEPRLALRSVVRAHLRTLTTR